MRLKKFNLFFYLAPTPYFNRKEQNYSHLRSRSVGTVSDDFQYSIQPQLHSSLSFHQPLLLTQKYVYESPTLRNKDLYQHTNNPYYMNDLLDPFDDENSSEGSSPIFQVNQQPNKSNIPPPPVPSKSTKPAYPKYYINKNPSF